MQFEFIEDVTSDYCFVARGESLSEVFCAAAAALMDATLECPEPLDPVELRHLELVEPSLELLLLRFLNELIYLRDAESLLLQPRDLRIEAAPGSTHLTGELTGEVLDPRRHRMAVDVKAATAHGLELVREEGGYRATVTLDV